MHETTWIEKLKPGDDVVIKSHFNGYTLAKVTKVTPKGRITAANMTFNQKGLLTGNGAVGVWLKEATPELVEQIRKEDVIKGALGFASDITVKKAIISFRQAEKLNLIMKGATNFVTFHSPVWVSLCYTGDSEDDCEPLYCYPLCEEYLEIINHAIRTNPKTKLGVVGLLDYITCDDEVMDFYLQNQIAFIHPTIKTIDGKLICEIEIGCKSALPPSALQALENALEKQFQDDWGQDVESVEMPLPDSVLVYVNGSARFGKKEDIERETGEQAKVNENPTVCVRLYHDGFDGFNIVSD